ncbi:MAG: hypothetical protein HC827_20070 [Cyanobacteria bacterium RM1_2_2]|nr:hypothetical protein [Cyanobacteria bacterium RM1_2_2]
MDYEPRCKGVTRYVFYGIRSATTSISTSQPGFTNAATSMVRRAGKPGLSQPTNRTYLLHLTIDST